MNNTFFRILSGLDTAVSSLSEREENSVIKKFVHCSLRHVYAVYYNREKVIYYNLDYDFRGGAKRVIYK